jgi:CRP-like cAMP-binding protein
VAARLGMLANRLVYLTADNASARIAKLLMDLALRHGDEPTAGAALKLTHQEIANITGVQRQTVTRLLGEFTTRGLLSARYGTIRVTNPELLARYAARRPNG